MLNALLIAAVVVSGSIGVWFMPAEAIAGASMDAKMAIVREHGRAGDWYYLHLTMPAQVQRIAQALPAGSNIVLHCESVAKCAALVATVKTTWAPASAWWIGYDLEDWANSEGDQADPVASVRTVAELAHSRGMRLLFIPCSVYMLRYHKAMIPQLAGMVDGWAVQGQSMVKGWFAPASASESETAMFARLCAEYVKRIRSGSATIPILLQLKLCTYSGGRWQGGMIAPQRAFYLWRDYWAPVRSLFAGVLILDAFDVTNPYEKRPAVYGYFVDQRQAGR